MTGIGPVRASRACAIVRRLPAIPIAFAHACDPSAERTALKEIGDADPDPEPLLEGHLDR